MQNNKTRKSPSFSFLKVLQQGVGGGGDGVVGSSVGTFFSRHETLHANPRPTFLWLVLKVVITFGRVEMKLTAFRLQNLHKKQRGETTEL